MPQPSSLNFVPNGHRRLCTKVIIIDDGMIESENLFVEISGDNNIVLQARIFITDNEGKDDMHAILLSLKSFSIKFSYNCWL